MLFIWYFMLYSPIFCMFFLLIQLTETWFFSRLQLESTILFRLQSHLKTQLVVQQVWEGGSDQSIWIDWVQRFSAWNWLSYFSFSLLCREVVLTVGPHIPCNWPSSSWSIYSIFISLESAAIGSSNICIFLGHILTLLYLSYRWGIIMFQQIPLVSKMFI